MCARLAVNGGVPVIKKQFPSWPVFDDTDVRAVEEVVKSGIWGVGGTRIGKFTEEYGKFQHVDHVLPVGNGTIAIDLALEALGIDEGDEVIVPDYTFMATAVAPVRRRANPVLVDVDPGTFCIDPDLIENAITGKTKAIIPVHFGGHPCDMTKIMKLAEKYGLFVIEDCAHAHGAVLGGKYAGAIGTIGTFSLQSSKTLSCGEGGLVVTNHEWLYTKCRSIHNAGRAAGEHDYNHYIPGTNYRITELQAGLLLVQLGRLEEQCINRDKNGKLLTQLLAGIDGVKPQARDPKMERHGHYLFTFILEADIDREVFKKAVMAEGVPLQREYPAVHTLACIRKRGFGNGEFPVSDTLASKSVWMYHHALLGDQEGVSLIAEAIKKVLANKNELH